MHDRLKPPNPISHVEMAKVISKLAEIGFTTLKIAEITGRSKLWVHGMIRLSNRS